MRKIFLFLVALFAMNAMATEGALNGKFSVSANKKVYFSQGNLQYRASTDKWQFATNQYDTIGIGNANIADDYDGWIDLFGWGSGGNPTQNTKDNSLFNAFTDWGTNPISNGGNQADLWYTLTKDEWNYLLVERTDAAALFGTGAVNGVNGVILLPDDWTLPEGAQFHNSTEYMEYNTSMQKYTNANNNNFSKNTYTPEQWTALENAGAVFLPAAGVRVENTMYYVNLKGEYWATEKYGTYSAYMLLWDKSTLSPRSNGENRYSGLSVRLVMTAPSEPLPTYVVTITQPEHGAINIVESVDLTAVEKNTVLHFTATPDEGYELDQWVNYAPLTGLVVTQDTTVSCVFKTEVPVPEKKLSGVFYVSNNKYVRFSQGNLQYNAAANKYRFAAEQYTVVSKATNEQISPTFAGWIDLFGWGSGNNPTQTSTDINDWSTTFTDWGLNPISNGGNQAGLWRTLGSMEWYRILYSRRNAISLFGFGRIDVSGTGEYINGVILLPDEWELPEGATFYSAQDKGVAYNDEQKKYVNENKDNFSHNTYTVEQWAVMEAAGAVFLPAAGTRTESTVNFQNADGRYWTDQIYGYNMPYYVKFDKEQLHPRCTGNYIYAGLSIRLVQEIRNYTVTREHPENGTIMPEGEVDLNNVPEGTVLYFTVATSDAYELDEWINYNPETGLVVTSDTTISCTLKKKTFEVTFVDWDDSVLKEDIVEWGNAAEAPADPVRPGYTFTGWDKDFSSVKSNLTVKAQYTQDFYDVSVITENGSVKATDTLGHGISLSNHFHYGYVLILTAVPDEGYEFDSWENYDPETGLIITGDTTVTCHFAKQTFEVVFVDWDDSVLKAAQTVEWGDAAEAPADPVRPGYTFTGWDTDFSSVKSDLTVKALYEFIEGIEDVRNAGVQCTKFLRNGQVTILRGEKEYTVLGTEL